MTELLGVELGATLAEAHAKLDHLNDSARPWTEQKDRGGKYKAVWQLKETPYASVYVKTNATREIEYITGFLREGAELPFEKIGETEKAPLKNDISIVWDVLRPHRPQVRVIAEGKDRKASVIKIFVVPRSPFATVGEPARRQRTCRGKEILELSNPAHTSAYPELSGHAAATSLKNQPHSLRIPS